MESSPKPIRCRAAVNRVAGEPLVIEEVVVSPPKAWEARIKIICTSLCHSDLTVWKMTQYPVPRILGHEAIGVVESVGEHVEAVAVGDTVVPTFLAHCRECEGCSTERTNLCTQFPFKVEPGMPRDKTSRFTSAAAAAAAGEVVHNFLGVSSFAEYTVVDVSQLTRLGSAAIAPEKACLLSCGISTGFGAAWKVAKVEKGSSVAVFGLGAVGLAVVEGARVCGASKIIGVDLNPDKFEIGKKFGLTDFVNPKEIGEKHVSEVIKEMTNGGANYCFECIGIESIMADAFQSSRMGWGKTIILGVQMQAPLCIMPFEFLYGKSITGSFFGGIKAKTDIPILINKYLNKELQLDEFITHEVGLEDINKAFDLLIQGKSLRCIIWMDK